MISDELPWYKKPIKGARAQKLLQISFGTSIFLSLVVAPMWYEYLTAYKTKKWITTEYDNTEYIQKQVYKKRLELRELAQKLIEEEKKKVKK
jgi:hypothetical protein